MNLWAQEDYIDASRGCRLGNTEPYETFTDNEGKLFREFRRLYGRCISKVYVDDKEIGWVFQSRVPYCDGTDRYLREVWVTLHDGPAEQIVKHQIHELGHHPS
ncbi:MAG: hypothetical protein ABSH28_05125 [Acidobacteriota bacterium]